MTCISGKYETLLKNLKRINIDFISPEEAKDIKKLLAEVKQMRKELKRSGKVSLHVSESFF